MLCCWIYEKIAMCITVQHVEHVALSFNFCYFRIDTFRSSRELAWFDSPKVKFS